MAGLRAIAEEVAVSVPNGYGVIKRCAAGSFPKRGMSSGHKIVVIPAPMAE